MAEKVQAAVRTGPSKTEFREFPMPDIPEDAALIKMEVAGICGTDVKIYGTPPSSARDHGPREYRHHRQGGPQVHPERKGVKEGDLVFVEHYVMCGKCEWCHRGEYRHCENTDWRTNPDAIRYGYTSAEKAPHLWGGFAQYVYLAVERRRAPCAGRCHRGTGGAGDAAWRTASSGRCSKAASATTPPCSSRVPASRACRRPSSASRRAPRSSSSPGRPRTRSGWRSPRSSAPTTLIDVQKEDPLARIKEITGGKGVDVVARLHRGRRHHADAARRRRAQAQGRDHRGPGRNERTFPNFPIEQGHGEIRHAQERARPQLQGVRARPAAARLAPLPAGEGHDPHVWAEGRGPGHQVGRRQGRARRDPRLAHAVGVSRRLAHSLSTIDTLNARPANGRQSSICGEIELLSTIE